MRKRLLFYFGKTGRVSLLAIFALMMLSQLTAFAQSDHIVTGLVLDQNGAPLEGVLVKVPQTIVQTRTKKDGTFLLNVPASATQLGFSAKGKQYQTVALGERSSINVRMLPFNAADEDDSENSGQGPANNSRLVGTVSDDKGPVIGATVRVKGTNTAVTTNVDGQFRLLSKPAAKYVLQISSIGFITKEVSLSPKQSSIDITLAADAKSLQEVVVVGYNTQKKVNLTGAVSSVDFSSVQNVPQSNTINILEGRVPGVSIVQPGGQPGADQGSVSIRGIGTLNDSSPLVIIDGSQATLDDLGRLSPAEIANISVLKDASSAAIYGARGANGVILVSTKTPGKGKLQINLNSYYGIQKATYLPKFVDSWQFMTLHNEATDQTPPLYDPALIERLKNGQFSDSLANTKWPQELFKSAPITSHTLNINGGTQNISYQSTFGYLNQQGLMNNTKTERYNFRSNVIARISDRVETGLNLWGNVQNIGQPWGNVQNPGTNFSPINGIMTAMNQAYPFVPLKTSNGNWGVYNYANGVVSTNPVLLTYIGRDDTEVFKGNLQTYLQIRPTKDWRIRSTFTYTYGNSYEERFNPTYSYPNLQGLRAFFNLRSQSQNLESQDKQLQWQTTAIYNKVFKEKHAVTFLAGHEFINFQSRQFNATGFSSPSNSLQTLGSVVSDFNVGGGKQEWSLQSFFGRINYIFNNKYLFEANVRADGSSRFPSGRKYGVFPSVSGGWIISEEKFFENVAKTVNLLKFRAGWGKTGNDRIGNFPYTQYINLSNFYGIGGALQPAGAITAFANPNLKWESTSSTNVGMDLGVFQNKLLVTADVYNKLTSDILFQLPLPASFGTVTSPVQNIGTVRNRGWEIDIQHRNKIGKNVNYTLGVNMAYVKNKIVKLNGQESIYGESRYILREGEAINSYYGYQFDGLYKSAADTVGRPRFSASGFQPGTSILKDVNGDGKLTPDDRIILGNANTPYTFGITGSVSYKGFDMSFLFQGVQGKTIYIYDFGNRPGNAGNTNFWTEWWDNRYDAQNNPEGTWPVLKRTAPEIGQVTNSFFLRDATYIRLKNIEVGYSFSTSLLSKLKMRNLRIYATAQNLLTFSNLIKQIDPERDALTVGNTTYPQTKVITAGLSASF